MSEINPGLKAYTQNLQVKLSIIQQQIGELEADLQTTTDRLMAEPHKTSLSLLQGTFRQALANQQSNASEIDRELQFVHKNPHEAIKQIIERLQRKQAGIDQQMIQKQAELARLRSDPDQRLSTELRIGTIEKELENLNRDSASVLQEITLFSSAS